MAIIDEYKKKSIEETLKELSTSVESGISENEAEERIKSYGFNEIPEKEEPLWHRLLKRFWGPIPWMIETAAVLSALVKKWEDFSIIIILLLVNAVVDFWQEHKAISALKVLREKLARRVLVLRDGKWIEMDVRFLVPGDVVKLKIGDIVPADVKLVGDGFVQIDQSALTGESLPVTKGRGDVAFANSVVKKGEVVAVVVATGLDTYFGRTVQLVARAETEKKSHFQEMVIKVGNFLIIISLVVIITMVIVELMRGTDKLELLRFSLVLTVASIPVALPAVLTVTMAIGALSLAQKHIIVSRLSSIEELAGVDVLCSDKTGTLTQNRMSISEVFVFNEFSPEDLMFYAALASKEENRDPIEIPIFEWLKIKGIYEKVKGCRQIDFVPFDPVGKRTEAIVDCDKERIVVTKGAPQVVLELSNLSKESRNKIVGKIEEFAQKGFRTIGVAYKDEGREGFHFVGLIPLFDPPREDSKEAVSKAKQLGVEVKMLTGDNIAIAKYIADLLEIGDNILNARELKGEDFDEYLVLADVLTRAIMIVEGKGKREAEERAKSVVEIVKKELRNLPLLKGTIRRHESEIVKLIEEANGFAEVFPEDKYFIVDKLQKAGHIVGMTGDGVNDAPALKKADCGIAVSNATDAARAAADLVLLKSGLSVIVKAFEIAREIFGRMQTYTIYRIAETIRVVGFMGFSIIFLHFFPVTPIMIIILALLNDIPILSIAYDRVKVSEKPVRWNMYEINVMSFYLGFAGFISSSVIVFLLLDYWKLPLDLVQSIVFLKLAVKGHGTLYNARIMDHLWKKPWPSPVLWVATYWTRVAGTIVGVYGFGLLTPTGWGWAMFIWGYALVWLLINDYVKLFVWKMYRERRFMFAPGHFKILRKIFSA